MATKKSAAKKSSKKASKAPVAAVDIFQPANVDSDRRSMIITFKRKDQRPDASADKLSIVNSVLTTDIKFLDNETLLSSGSAIPVGARPDTIGFDINEFEAPIVVASLTNTEIKHLESNGNVSIVEEDGQTYAVGDCSDFSPYVSYAGYGANVALRRDQFFVEGQPSVMAETIPAGVSQIKAPSAWDSSRGKGINVAVLDTGIDYNHPDLSPNYRGGVSFVPGQTVMDGNSHGTHCAGTIGAAINGAGVVGVAPAANLYAVKVLDNSGSGQWGWLITGIDWCIKNNMRVLSMSMGGGGAPAALEAMCNAAFNKGLLLVAAAGNAGPGMGTVIQPASYQSVIAVSAIDSANQIAGFSSRGPEVELAAPGVDVLSTIPGGGYGKKSGTSMACPHVSGSATVAWGAHRFVNNITIRRLLAWTSDNLGVPGRDPLFGYGRVDADQAAGELTPPPAIPGIP
jgi:subtilisin